MTTLDLPQEFGYVVIVAAIMAFHAVLQGMYVGKARNKCFNNEQFKTNPKVRALSDEHKKLFGCEINKTGYPDMGSGVYSQHLSYAEWLMFNNAQRAHQNYLEHLTPVLAFLLLSGLVYPRFAAALGVVYIIGREVYGQAYRKHGADKRLIGAIIFDIALLGLFGGCICAGSALAGCTWLAKL
eukprot:GDKI01018859.1.p2 GENE.GDKI01018859.1~~GDKI01018859.1.p2  ORF type:complete len:183 (+),score=71.38 GDKI01018859.1:110-658(+)